MFVFYFFLVFKIRAHLSYSSWIRESIFEDSFEGTRYGW